MADNETIPSNATELLKCRQTGPKIIPVNGKWEQLEPNSYKDFGRKDKKVARSPINSSRMRRKSTIVGYTASVEFEVDLTSNSMRSAAEEFLFAATRYKGKAVPTSIAADGYIVASGGDSFKAGDLIYVEGVSSVSNLGLKVLTANGAAAKINLGGLTADLTAKVTVNRVGHQFAAGDLSVEVIDGLPSIVSENFDMRTLGLIPGEQFYIGADNSANVFASEENTGWVRVKSVTQTEIILDKTQVEFVDDAGTGKIIRIYFGDVVKNEAAYVDQKTYLNTFRRMVGSKVEGSGIIQSELLYDAIANELTFTIPEQDKIVCTINYMCRTYGTKQDDSLVDPSGTIIPADDSDVFNSTGDAKILSFWSYPSQDNMTSAPEQLIGAFSDLKLTVKNNIAENRAITHMGSFSHTPGFFDAAVSGSGYFSNIDIMTDIGNNVDMSFSFGVAKENKGVLFDMVLISASSDGLNVAINAPITLDVDSEASSGKKYDPNMNHALLINFFPYLPNVACDNL